MWWGVLLVASAFFFGGLGMMTEADDEGAGLDAHVYLTDQSYEESMFYLDVVRDFASVFQEIKSLSVGRGSKEDLEGYAYDYILDEGEVFFHHGTNIPDRAYRDYVVRLQGEGREVDERELRRELADWYFTENFSCYCIWDGVRFLGSDMISDVIRENLMRGSQGMKGLKIAVGIPEEKIQERKVVYAELQRNIRAGLAAMVFGAVIVLAGLALLVPALYNRKRSRACADVMFVLILLAGKQLIGSVQELTPYEGYYLQTGSTRETFLAVLAIAVPAAVAAVVMFYAVLQVVCGLLQKLGWRDSVFLYSVFRWAGQRISGAAYWEEGVESCLRKRFLFTLFTACVVLFPVLIYLWYQAYQGEMPVTVIFISFGLIFLGIIFCIFSRRGTKRILREYRQLSDQMEQIYGGRYQNHDMLPDSSIFVRESRRMSMLGCQLQEHVQNEVQAEKMKIDLITNVSHDLKTPLTSIISYIDLLSREELPPAAADYVRVLEKKSGHLKKMIHDVFDLSKASSGNLEVNWERVDLKRLLVQTLADMEREIGEAPVKVVTEYPDTAVMIKSDGEKLYRILQNILDNALKYSMKSTRVYLSLNVERGQAYLTVKNVAGYEMDFTREEVLGRFFRGDKARSTEGSGLGLAIAKEFAELCGGRLDLTIDGDVFMVEIVFPVEGSAVQIPKSENI